MSYPEEDYIQLSALQHYLFCPRQCAIIHIEQAWTENMLTAMGRLMHDKAHETKYEKRANNIITRGLRLFSKKMGVSGQTDVVEFHKAENSSMGCTLLRFSGIWQPYPVEYKRGKPKTDHSDEVQLCAQAICLEEMLDIGILEGSIFYGKSRRRQVVAFTDDLRDLTQQTALNIHALFKSEKTPVSNYSKRCNSCSLIEQCLPKRTSSGKRASNYVRKMTDKFL